jgi:predicted CXXCH cytochrome family protein
MCADCHSTNLQKNYDAATDAYQTTWTDINVSCEACHGPGSEHKEWADAGTDLDPDSVDVDNKGLTVSLNEREGASWHADNKTGLPIRSEANDSRAEIEVCARCHSRRSQLSDDFVPGQPFMNAFHPALLTEGLYYADGQMQDEVYVWGSFQQSKMFAAGVTCSDCHNPHSTELKAPRDQVCAQCHTAEKYASAEHHFHAPDSAGASCIACHMPVTTLMGIDERNDHGFRIPQPAVSAAIDAPNACSQCHVGRTSSWADAQLQAWYGKRPRGYQHFSAALAAFRSGDNSAPRSLLALAMDASQPAIARATAYSSLGAQLDQNSLMGLQQGLNDTDPLIRQGALSALELVPMQYRIVALPAVWDDVRSVRIQAARLLAAYPADELRDDRRDKLNAVLEEYIQTQLFNAERPEAQLNLAGLYVEQGRMNDAEQAFRKALDLQSQFVPAYVNFAQFLGSTDREAESNTLLEAGIKAVPDSPDLYHALGLSQVRQKNSEQALVSLARAAQLDGGNRRYQYVYAVALQSSGEVGRAVEVLHATLQHFPGDIELLYALATFSRDAGATQAALSYAQQLQALLPNDQNIAKLVQSLQ